MNWKYYKRSHTDGSTTYVVVPIEDGNDTAVPVGWTETGAHPLYVADAIADAIRNQFPVRTGAPTE